MFCMSLRPEPFCETVLLGLEADDARWDEEVALHNRRSIKVSLFLCRRNTLLISE